MDYEKKLKEEIENYRQVENVHDLPEIFHYWSNKFLLPMFREFGFSSLPEFYLGYLERACREVSDGRCRFLSVGSGNCDVEVSLAKELTKAGHENFLFECLELNRHMIKRGTTLAKEAGVLKRMVFVNKDIASWKPEQQYQVVIANQSLHHFVELEALFDAIAANLSGNGYFLTQDTVGRNGHMRWPEVLEIMSPIWAEMPERCKYNHQLKRLEESYINWDCSGEGLEGIRAQDIMPLLVQRFGFEKFLTWGGVIDLFIDRGFGHNFDAEQPWDRTFIDMLHYLNMFKLVDGTVKPTQVLAAMTLRPVPQPQYYRNLSPEFCLRRTGKATGA